MRARRSLTDLFLVPALVFGLSSVASKCSDDPVSLGHDKGDAGGSDNDGGGGAANAGAVGGSGGTATDAGSVTVCPTSACGPQLGLANYTCSDGSLAGPTGRCLPRGNGVCGWEIRECPSSGGTGTSDGGKVTHVDSGTTTPCSDIEDTIRSLVAEHQSCTTTADCGNVAIYCVPGWRCTGTQYVNQTIDQSAFTALQHELNQCMTGDPNQIGCSRCFIADQVPACVNGICGPAPTCAPPPPCGSQCPPGSHSPTDANGCVFSCTCVPD
jgi:hypothetical protein